MRGKGPPPPQIPLLQMNYIVSGTSKQWGMRPRCDPTIHTAPTNVYGRVSLDWVFLPWVPETSGLWVSEAVMGLEIHHGVVNAQWGLKHINVGHRIRNAPWG